MTFRISMPIKDNQCQGAGTCGYCEGCIQIFYKHWSTNQGIKDNGEPGDLIVWQKRNYELDFKRRLRERKEKALLEKKWALDEVGEVKCRLWTIGWPDASLCEYGEMLEDEWVNCRVERAVQMCREDKYGMGQSWLVVENYSNNKPDGGNMHCHILVLDHCTNSQGRKPQGDGKKIAKYLGIPANGVDWGRPLKDKQDFKNSLNYILGNKVEEGKKHFVMLDKEWRDEMGLRNIYVHMDEKKRVFYENMVEEDKSIIGKGENG